MPRRPGYIVGMFVVAGMMGMSNCASGGSENWTQVASAPEGVQLLHISGTVRRVNLEGGLWVIRDPAGTQFNPTNLPEAFRADGTAVEVDARRRDGMVSIGMVGPIIDVIRIRKRPAATQP